ncbi:hypothetical protein ciss_21230 [Carboxydothermus islandicus]|uniref:Uncharacterized protein n=1 Tax=Carboxydothermus islandicus TaxID=661089 RepID=A0A1L8D4U6_9THEO|nr:HD-GYP domain-containing protein [Carboxydothermus islandicus]GAV26190.1 hypothetical protein ciss_21230 [Carboxydothermus islandicus]
MISAKDRYTGKHSIEVGSIAKTIGKYLGFGGEHLEMLEIAGLLHDLGKLAVPLKILNKPGKLTAKEFELIKVHPFYTYKTLSQVKGMEKIACWAGYHHERLDGSGYPFHLTSHELELESRIIQVADVLAALLEDRPYRRALTPQEIFQILRGEVEKGKLDAQVVEVGLKVVFQTAFQVRWG